MKYEKLLIAGILVTGAIALFAKSAGAAQSASALDYDPKVGKPRRQTGASVAAWEFPIDVYEWGDANAPDARLIAASGDPSSWVAFRPPTTGELTSSNILASGSGPKTAAIRGHLLNPAGSA